MHTINCLILIFSYVFFCGSSHDTRIVNIYVSYIDHSQGRVGAFFGMTLPPLSLRPFQQHVSNEYARKLLQKDYPQFDSPSSWSPPHHLMGITWKKKQIDLLDREGDRSSRDQQIAQSASKWKQFDLPCHQCILHGLVGDLLRLSGDWCLSCSFHGNLPTYDGAWSKLCLE